MKELNFNVVKLWAVWNTIEKLPGEFDFSCLDQLVEICSRNELKVIINTIPEGAPYWTQDQYPDSLYHTSDGHALHYSGPANIPSAGWPGLCPDSSRANDLINNFIYRTAAHFGENDTVIAIDVWNEPHLEPMFDYSGELLCYCEHSVNRFRSWLKERYVTLDKLNEAWFRGYSGWEQVAPPIRFGTYPDMIDWRRFWLYNLASWLKSRAAAARSGAPGKLIQSHSPFSGFMGGNNNGGLGNELGDEFLLANEVDVYGLSSFPLWLMGKDHIYGHLINVEIIAEAAAGKPFYQTELQGGAGKAGLLGGLVPSADDIRQWNWNIIAAGGKGSVYWQYAPEPSGMESPGFGLVDFQGADTPRSLAAALCASRFDQDYLTGSSRVLPVNGIFLSRTSDLITYAAREESQYAASFKGIYKSLVELGIPVRFVHEDTLEKAICENLKVLYLPMTLGITNAEMDVLQSFVENGGKLILESCSGIFRCNGEVDPDFSFLGKMLGMKGISIEPIQDEMMTVLPVGNSGPKMCFTCAGYRLTYKTCAEDAHITACFTDEFPAALHRYAGKGEVIWLNGFVGAEYDRLSDPATREMMSLLFESRGYDEFSELDSNGLLVRLLKNEETFYIVAVNHSTVEKSMSVRLIGKESMTVTVKPRDGKIVSV